MIPEARLQEIENEPGHARDEECCTQCDLVAEVRRLQEFVVAHTLLDKGVVDFDLHAEVVERFRRAQEANIELIRAALTEESENR